MNYQDREIREFLQPLVFNTFEFEHALDNFDPADPHRRADEIDDVSTAPVVNQPLYDTSKVNPMKDSNLSLEDFPDKSDEFMSDFKMAQMLGKPLPTEVIVDIDTTKDYDLFIQNSIKNILKSENEYNIRNSTLQEGLKQSPFTTSQISEKLASLI
jgi:hypothetical protein